jgi:hypothetical protein
MVMGQIESCSSMGGSKLSAKLQCQLYAFDSETAPAVPNLSNLQLKLQLTDTPAPLIEK